MPPNGSPPFHNAEAPVHLHHHCSKDPLDETHETPCRMGRPNSRIFSTKHPVDGLVEIFPKLVEITGWLTIVISLPGNIAAIITLPMIGIV